MIYGEASAIVAATPRQVLDLVCDVERYRLADTKIRNVLDTTTDGDQSIVRFRSKLRGLPTPAVRQCVARTGDERVDIRSVPSWQDWLVSFRGSVVCTPAAGGTRIVHREEFRAHGPLRPVFDRFLGAWLRKDIEEEVARLAHLLDDTAHTTRRTDS